MANMMNGYEELLAPVKRLLFQNLSLQSSLTGRELDILEVGIGAGPNIKYYYSQARTITGLDPNTYMFPYAQEALEKEGYAASKLKVVQSEAESMPFESDSFDCAVCTLTLCSVSDPSAVVAEMRRVVRPGGLVLALEHVQAPERGLLRLGQSLFDPIQQILADGCHLTRDSEATLAGFEWADLNVQRFNVDGLLLLSPHISARAIV